MRFLFFLFILIGYSHGCSFISNGMRDHHVNMVCNDCHTEKKGQYKLKAEEDPSKPCEECHKYKNAEDHHTDDPGDGSVKIPFEFKLYNGKMTCLTCHKIHSDQDYRNGTQRLLVGGKYSDRRTICFKCHDKQSYKGMNPHKEMLYSDGALNYYTCRLCHASPPNPEIDGPEDVEFKSANHFLCWRCHPPMNSDFFDVHFLKKTKVRGFNLKEMHGFSGEDTFDTMKEKEKNASFIMPLDRRGRLTCSTCHNPHQPGVMVDKKAAKGAGGKNRLRLTGKCSDCHQSR